MNISKLVGERTKESPANVISKGHEMLLRGGYIKQVCNGVYSLLMPAVKVQKKIIQIIREEMDKVNGQEVLFPVLMPKELWQLSGRYNTISNEMFRLKDRNGHDMVLGMTHEEAAVQMANNTVKSYDQLPFMIYQIQTKLRDEPRARAGLIRTREFTMKDAYSFHTSQEDLEEYYEKMYQAYNTIFKRIGMKNYIAVESSSGMMGGSKSHEFMLISNVGEDSLAVCENCLYKANAEVANSILPKYESALEQIKLVNTGENKTIEDVCDFLNVQKHQICKAVVYFTKSTKKYCLVFIRGDLTVNETKLSAILGEEIVALENLDEIGLVGGYIGPKEFNIPNLTVLYDISLKSEKNMVVGANEKYIHKTGFSFDRDIHVEKFENFYEVQDGHFCPLCKKPLKIVRGVEIGQIFQLGTKYTKAMNMTIHSQTGENINPIMGCYGIGVGRAIACVAEENADEKGLVWPINIAPWQVYIAPLNFADKKIKNEAENLYEQLEKENIEVLFDDRNCSAGVKFADSELLGIPIRIVLSERNFKNNQYEIVVRNNNEKYLINTSEVVSFIKNLIEKLK